MTEEIPQGAILDEKYQVLSTIGRGAWSSVYLARNLEQVGGFVAIKQMSTHNLADEEAHSLATSFLQEVEILASLSHEGLPAIHDYFCVGDSYYLIMEWIAGQTLLEVLEERGEPLSPGEVVTQGIELCSILSYLHTQSPHPIVVGDLKPGNIMRTFDGQLKIVDFGVARQVHLGSRARATTDDGYSFVTPGYSPPEQYKSMRLEPRSDIYALAATLYHLMTRQPLERFRFQIPPLRKFAPSAPAGLEDLLARCLQTQPSARPGDARSVRRSLLEVQDLIDPRVGGQPATTRSLLESLYQKKRAP